MSDCTPEQQKALDSSEEIFRRTREAPLAAREIMARKQAEVDAAHAREFPSYEKLRIERDALRVEVERLKQRIERGERATQFAFPEGLENDKNYAAYYYAQSQCRDALREEST